MPGPVDGGGVGRAPDRIPTVASWCRGTVGIRKGDFTDRRHAGASESVSDVASSLRFSCSR